MEESSEIPESISSSIVPESIIYQSEVQISFNKIIISAAPTVNDIIINSNYAIKVYDG